MGTYLIPRNLKGEGRILFFSYKALVYTVIGIIVGYGIKFLFGLINLKMIGTIVMAILGLIGFLIGTLKMPNNKKIEITRKTGGEKVDEILVRLIKFKMKKNIIYVYKGEVEKNG